MNAPIPLEPLALPSAVLERLFPFHVVLNQELAILAHGPGLPRICTGATRGMPLGRLLRPCGPLYSLSARELMRHAAGVLTLESVTTGIRLRGPILHGNNPPDAPTFYFLGAPWVTEPGQLDVDALQGLDLDAGGISVELLHALAASRMAQEEAQRRLVELARATQELAHSAARKNQFLANTSHELRTPLNGIMGMATLLLRTNLSSSQRNYAQKILKSGEALLTVVNDVLDFAKIEAGKLTLDPTDFDPRATFHEVAELFAVPAQAKGLELLCRVAPDVPTRVRGDTGRLRQMACNLLSNAVKFTREGEIVLSVEAVARANDGRTVELKVAVRDTGPGIPASALSTLFQPFSQVEGGGTESVGGTGLGLAICRQLAELMGGTVGVESNPAHGSTFWFTAALATVDAPEPATIDELNGQRILVATRNATAREHLSSVLQRWGAQVHGAVDADAAWLQLEEHAETQRAWNAMVVDLASDAALALLERVGNDPRFQRLHTVMITPIGSNSAAGLSNGARLHAVVTKPVREEELLAALTGPQQPLLQVERTATPTALEVPDTPGNLRVLVVDDNPINVEVAVHMLHAGGFQADAAGSGQEALEALARFPYRLVLMDLQMPGLDGFATTRRIRELQKDGTRTPIVAMTAHAMDTDRKRALDEGMDDHLAKPIKFDALLSVVHKWLGREPVSLVTPASSVAPGLDPDAVDLSVLEELRMFPAMEGAPDIVTDVVGKFLADLPRKRKTIADAVGNQDADTVAKQAHSLRSTAGVVGALRLARMCAALEEGILEGNTTLDAVRLREFDEECTRVVNVLQQVLADGQGAAPAASAEPDPVSAFFTELENHINEHPALSHRFLQRFGEEELTRDQLIAYAIQHYKVTEHSSRNLAFLVANCPEEEGRILMAQRLYEELGEPSRMRDRAHLLLLEAGLVKASDVSDAFAEFIATGSRGDVAQLLIRRGLVTRQQVISLVDSNIERARELSHPALLRRFLRALGVTPQVAVQTPALPETVELIQEYARLCREGHWLEGLGAMGPGTESVVPLLCYPIHEGIQRSRVLAPEDAIYWTLQIHWDEGRGRNLVKLMAPACTSTENRELVARGTQRALDARKRWFDGLERLVFEQRPTSRHAPPGPEPAPPALVPVS